MLPNLVIWGAGGHASVIADIVQLQGEYALVGYLDDARPDRSGQPFGGARVLGGCDLLPGLVAGGVSHLLVGIGDCRTRLRLADRARELGLTLGQAIHPKAVVARTSEIGAGSVVVAGAVINPGAVLGANVIINTAASVDHDCRIGEGVHISPGAHLAGDVAVGRGAWIGTGATITPGVSIGEYAIIGAGSVVLRHVPDNVTAYGVPARVIRENGRP